MTRAGRSPGKASTGKAGRVTGVAPVRRSETGWSTGSSTGTASAAGATTTCTALAVAASATSASGADTVETVPGGTTCASTGTPAMALSASPEIRAATGCASPGAAVTPAAEPAGGGETVSERLLARDRTVPVAPPGRDEESGPASADAAVDESVSHMTAAAPARRAGRMARHGELIRAIRTTPQ